MPDGNGEAAAWDLLSFLLLFFICWGIYIAEKFARGVVGSWFTCLELPTPIVHSNFVLPLQPLQGGDEQFS